MSEGREPRHLGGRRTVVTVLLALAVLAGCRDDRSSPELDSLRDESLASASFDGLHLLREHERDAQSSSDTVTGKTVDAKIIRVFEPDDPQKLPEYFRRVVAEAKDEGWQAKYSYPDGFTGQKTLEQGPGQIDVVLAPCDSQNCLFLYLSAL